MSTPKTLLILHRGGSQIRGSEEALFRLIDGLDPDRFRPVVLCSDAVLGAQLGSRAIAWQLQVFPEILVSRGEQRLPLSAYAKAISSVVRFGRSHHADVVLCSGGGPCQLGVPSGRLLRVPVVGLFHHPAPRNYHRFWLTRRVSRMIYTSRYTAEHSAEHLGPKGDVVYIGIDARGRYAAVERDAGVRAQMGIAPNDVVFGQVGALVPHKGHDVLLAAFARVAAEFPHSRLLIVGTGPQLARLEETVRARGLEERVTFTGYVPDTRLFFQHVLDVNVLASHEEGFGLVNLEASACGLPNIATDGTGIRETVVAGETGFLFPDGDSNALADEMLRLGHDAALRRRLGTNGRELVVTRFAVDAYADHIQQLLQATLQR